MWRANWETLRRQIPAGLNFCATGLPYWTLDIWSVLRQEKSRSYGSGCGDYEQASMIWVIASFIVRWFQYGAFLPMFRAQMARTHRAKFGVLESPANWSTTPLVSNLRLRYRLMPYIYSRRSGHAAGLHHDARTYLSMFRHDRTRTIVGSMNICLARFSRLPGDQAHVLCGKLYSARRSGKKRVRSICRPAAIGTISGQGNDIPADKRLRRMRPSRRRPCMYVLERLFLLALRFNFTGDQAGRSN